MKRISRDECNLRIANLIAQRGTCQRAQVGAVLTIDGRVISTGYNGGLGDSNCEARLCNLSSKCIMAVHAEANAICHAAKHDIGLSGCTLYCTYSPCLECAKLIVQAGIVRVVYDIPYRLTEGIELLQHCGIEIIHLPLTLGTNV